MPDFQKYKTISRSFPVFPGGFYDPRRFQVFPVFPEPVDTLQLDSYTFSANKT
jgi:hypothetical protein